MGKFWEKSGLLRGLAAAFALAATIGQHQSPQDLCPEIGEAARAKHEFIIPSEGPRAAFVNNCRAITRTLTKKEVALAREVFGDSIDYSRVRVHSAPYLPWLEKRAMTPSGEIFLGAHYHAYRRYSGHDLSEMKPDGFIHEMTHVWQYQNGILNPVIASIKERLNRNLGYEDAYSYFLEAEKDLVDYGLEQQAQIIEDSHALEKQGTYPANGLNIAKSPAEYKALFDAVMKNFRADPSYARGGRAARPQPPSAG